MIDRLLFNLRGKLRSIHYRFIGNGELFMRRVRKIKMQMRRFWS